jgi:hypothetical protein
MKNRWCLRAVVLLTLAVVLNVTFSAAAEAGSSGDPLVTLSYLNNTYLTSVMAKVDAKIASRNTALGISGGTASGSASTFEVVTLNKGQTLTGGIGCELMLRVGTATCTAASAPGLIDETTGSTLAAGKALTQNHLYMATIENRGAKATAATTKLLVRGSYTIA